MKSHNIESGLLSVFRLFTAIRLALALVGIGLGIAGIGPPGEIYEPSSWFSLVESGLLLAYLSWSWSQQRLGKWYFPIALGVATLGPVLATIPTTLFFTPSAISLAQRLAGQWQTVLILLAPLILISWRYSFRIVVGYTMALVLLDFVSAFILPVSWTSLVRVLFLVALFRTLFYLLIGYAIHRLAAELREQNASLEQANRRLSNYALMTEQLSVSRERNRLARELHDTLAHTLSGMAVQLEAVETLWDSQPDQALQTIQTIHYQTRQGLGETRRAIQALRASPLEDFGLAMAIENLGRGLAERTGAEVSLDLQPIQVELTHEVEQSLYRVTEEALRNVEQHARATVVHLSLTETDGRICLSVEDDGGGFDPEMPAPEDRFGLLGMQERADAVGGILAVDSGVSHGTRLRFTLEV